MRPATAAISSSRSASCRSAGSSSRIVAIVGYAAALLLLFASTSIPWLQLVFPVWVLLVSIDIVVLSFRNAGLTGEPGAVRGRESVVIAPLWGDDRKIGVGVVDERHQPPDDGWVAGHVDAVGLGAGQELQQLGLGQGYGQVRRPAVGGGVVDEGAVAEFHPVVLMGVGEVPGDRQPLAPGLGAVDPDGGRVEQLGDGQRRGQPRAADLGVLDLAGPSFL